MNSKIYFIIEIVLIISSLLTSFALAFSPNYVKTVIDIELVLYLLIIFFNFRKVKAFNMYQVWIVSYIFIIWSEMCIIANNREFDVSYITPFIRFSVANACLLLGYLFYKGNTKISFRSDINVFDKKGWFAVVLLFLAAFFIYEKNRIAMINYYEGRSLSSAQGATSLLKSLTDALGLLLPALIAYYIKYIRKWPVIVSVAIVFPIFLLQLFLSTRYKFLFSVLPFLVITDIFNVKYKGKKNFVLLAVCFLLFILLSSYIKNNRAAGFENVEESFFALDNDVSETDKFTVKFAAQMSPEGVVRMARYADKYFSDHDLHQGKETAFIFYFWIPRSVWPDKPVLLDYWLIREFNPYVSDSFSSASGFIGELRADFGWGCLFFIFLFGMLLRRLDSYCNAVFSEKKGSFEIVLAAILFPWIFFFVRSPITSTMALSMELIIYYILSKVFVKGTSSITKY